MLEKIEKAICDYNMLDKNQFVVCALSGGADSVAMTLALKSLGFDIKCVHVNHNLRGDESDADEAFCVDFCKRNDIVLEVFSVDVKAYVKQNGASCEEAARALRYDCLQKCALGAKIATAHTLDDNFETVLMNMIRGTGLKGLCGIPAVRNNIIRPLIFVSRKQVEDYLDKLGEAYVTDSTNCTDDFTRNKIRHNVVPALKDINPAALNNTLRMKQALEAENAYIQKESDKAFEDCFDGKNTLCALDGYDAALRRRCIMRFCWQNNIECSFKRVMELDEMLVASANGRIDVGNGFDAIFKSGNLILHKRTEEFSGFCRRLNLGKNEFAGNRIINAELIEYKKGDKINILLAKDYIDYDKIKGKPFLHCRKRGDKIRLCNRNHTSSVKTLLNANVMRHKRDTLCFISDDEGLIYIEGIGIADRVKLDENTKTALKITAYSD